MLFYPLYYNIISLISLKTTHAFQLFGFAENQNYLLGFNIRNGVRITESSDNEDLDNQGPTVPIMIAVWTSNIYS